MASYDLLAEEYYLPECNRTCQCFRTGSKALISKLFAPRPEQQIIEVGAGRSLAAELLDERSLPLDQLLITDASSGMLNWSAEYGDRGAQLMLAEATSLPVADHSVTWLIASLADPFNTPAFWTEAARVLTRNGQALFTTPADAWAQQFRHEPTARFHLLDGREVAVPSTVCSASDQVEMIEATGLRCHSIDHFQRQHLADHASPKLRELAPTTPVVTCYQVID